MQETNIQAAQRRAAAAVEASNRSSSGPGIMEQFGVESEVGGAAGMGEASLGAYREMAAASISLGQPEMLYALLILSVSHTAWFEEGTRDRYSAASLLGEDNFIGNRTNSNQMREALRPHLGTLLPRILRARHDPNPQTREQMSSLWVGLTGGGAAARVAITQNLLTTADVLIEDASSKLWRARVGALGGLAEIIVGREWLALGGGPPVLSDDDLYDGRLSSAGAGVRLLRLWRVVTRALDDIRGAVRESGETLGRAVRALTIRLCDPTQLDKSSGEKRGREEQLQRERDASAAAATAVRWIVKHGLSQPVPEAAGLCISTLTEIVGICRPKILESVLPDLLRSLLTAVSGLEPAALNYLQLRVDNQEGLERLRLEIVQRGPLATAVTKCLELLPQSSIHTQQSVISQLNTALRISAGFATRAAVADAVATMCNTCQSAFSFPGVYGTANPSVSAFLISDHSRSLSTRLLHVSLSTLLF
jgi:proteasome component ECM29